MANNLAGRMTFLLISLMVSPMSISGDRITDKAFTTRSEVIARHGMAATSQTLATGIAIEILKAGGSAVDAAIAANAALGLMEPTGNGIGGDLFAIVWDQKTGKLYGLNGSGRSPASLTADKVPAEANGTIPLYSSYAWSVPGTAVQPPPVRGLPNPMSDAMEAGRWLPAFRAQDPSLDRHMEKYGLEVQDWRPAMYEQIEALQD